LQREELAQLNKVKDQIFSVISHDLRAPVNTLVSLSQLLDASALSPEKFRAYSDVLKKELAHTTGVMDNLLYWARSQMAGFQPDLLPLDAGFVTQFIVDQILPVATRKGIRIENRVCGNTAVYGDVDMTALVMRNLIQNAVKYTPEGGIITISASAPHGRVMIKISDTGTGMEAPQVKAFNNPAFKAMESKPGTNKERGAGLGLLLCKNFVSLMHGSIELKSTPRKGSVFTVIFPAVDAKVFTAQNV
jgi:signal transduction histidine kinase